jgi:hypothetical protein
MGLAQAADERGAVLELEDPSAETSRHLAPTVGVFLEKLLAADPLLAKERLHPLELWASSFAGL